MRTRYLALVTGLASCATSRPAVTPPVPEPEDVATGTGGTSTR